MSELIFNLKCAHDLDSLVLQIILKKKNPWLIKTADTAFQFKFTFHEVSSISLSKHIQMKMTDCVLDDHICHLSVRFTQQYLKRCWGRAAPLGCCSRLPGQRALSGRRLKLWRRELGGSLGKPRNHCKRNHDTMILVESINTHISIKLRC